MLAVRGRDLLLALCMVAALAFGFASYVELALVGRKYIHESPWELWTTYFALAAVGLVIGVVVGSIVRSRRAAAGAI